MTRGGPWNSHWCISPCDAPNRQDNTVRHVKEALQEICRLVFRGQRASFWCIYVLNPSTLPWAFYIGRTASRDRSRPCRRRKASRLNSSLDSIWCVGWRPWLLGSFLYLCFDQWMINAFGLRPDAPVCSCWPSCFVSFCRMQGSVWFTAESKWAGHQVQRCKTYSFEPVWRRTLRQQHEGTIACTRGPPHWFGIQNSHDKQSAVIDLVTDLQDLQVIPVWPSHGDRSEVMNALWTTTTWSLAARPGASKRQ